MSPDNNDTTTRTWSVGQVAKLAGVSVRALHHYDDIGLVTPSRRTPAGYRSYHDEDLDRLRSVLVWRELDFSLDDIKNLLDDDTGTHGALVDQRRQLTNQIDRLTRIVATIDRELEAQTMNLNLTPEEKLEVFGDFEPDDYAAEAQERWGDTDAWEQSGRRTSRYTLDDWATIKTEADGIYQAFADLDTAGTDAESTEAMELAQRHRGHITKWFYDCSVEIHEGLGQMYVSDQRFTQNIDKHHDGLAAYMSAAITANALRQLDA